MAEETPTSPISEAIPPKANPLATPATAHTETLKLNPVVHRPVTGGVGATQTALKPGLKLPPKPGLATGLKLPPKQGATVSGLKPGVRLPTQPGLKPGIKLPTQSGFKPGIKLPTQSGLKPGIKLPAKPVIRKPADVVKPALSPTSAPKPAPVADSKPVADLKPVEMKPAEMKPVAEAPKPVAEAPKPIAEAPKPVAEAPKPVAEAPKAAAAAPTPAPTPAPVPEAEASKVESPKPLEALKAVTQNLKSITSPIPQQAILRKTGIIADAEMTEAQKQAAKAKTARISLSDAMGVAPVKNEALPMKTIRIKRPVDIPSATNPTATAKPIAPSTEPAKPVDTQADTKIATTTQTTTSFTQRKTLKIARPGGGAVRPSGKFGVKKPMTAASKPVGNAAAPAGGEVADIPDMPSATSVAPMAPQAVGATVPDVPKGVATLGVVVQLAACLAMAALAWLLFQDTQISPF